MPEIVNLMPRIAVVMAFFSNVLGRISPRRVLAVARKAFFTPQVTD